MATKGIDKDIRILGDRVAQYFDFEHFNEKWEDLVLQWGDRRKNNVYRRDKMAHAITIQGFQEMGFKRFRHEIQHKLGMYSSVGIDEIKDNKAPYLEKERLMSLLNVRTIPRDVVTPYNLNKQLTLIIQYFNRETHEITTENTKMVPSGFIPNHFLILQDWTKSEDDAWRVFLVYNYVFQKMMVYKGPQEGRFFDMTDFLIICALLQKISDHPNIITVHYIESINNIPFLGTEYIPCASLEQLIYRDNFLFPEKYLRNLSVLLKIIISICNAMSYAHSLAVLHLNLKPNCVVWTVQDFLETKILQMANPLDPDGILLTEFGLQSILDMRH